MNDKKTMDLIALASIPLMMTLGNSMLIPVLPIIEKELKISPFQSSLIITVYSIVAILFIPIAGYLSDRLGRKKIIIPSLILAAVGGSIAGLSSMMITNSYLFILIGRFLQGIGASGAFPVVIPTVGDMFSREKDISNGLGVIETANTAGKVLSPIIGSILAIWSWFIPFLTIPILCLISILLVLFFVKAPASSDEKKPKKFKEFLSSVKEVLIKKGRWLVAVFLIGCIIMFVLFGTLFYLSQILESTYKIHGVKKGIIIAVPLFALSSTSLITGKNIGENKILMKWLTLIGMLILSVSMLIMSFKPGLRMIIFDLVFGGIGIGMVLPCLDSFITEGIEKENRGTITSLYSSMRFIGVALGPPLFAVIMKSSVPVLFYIASGVTLIAVILALIAIRPSNFSTKGKFSPT